MVELKLTISEARKIFYYDKNEPMEYGVIRMYHEIVVWFNENIEKGWSHSWVPVNPREYDTVTFTFASESDVVAFKLRWT